MLKRCVGDLFDEWPTCRGPQKRNVVRLRVLKRLSSVRFRHFKPSPIDAYSVPCTTDLVVRHEPYGVPSNSQTNLSLYGFVTDDRMLRRDLRVKRRRRFNPFFFLLQAETATSPQQALVVGHHAAPMLDKQFRIL